MAEYYFETLPIHPQPKRLESLTGYLIRLAEANGSQSLTHSDFLRQTFNINRKSINSNRVTLLKDYCPTSFGSLPAVVHCSEDASPTNNFLSFRDKIWTTNDFKFARTQSRHIFTLLPAMSF